MLQNGGTQKGIGHVFRFRSPFGNHFVTFLNVFGHFFAYLLLPPPFWRQGDVTVSATWWEFRARKKICSPPPRSAQTPPPTPAPHPFLGRDPPPPNPSVLGTDRPTLSFSAKRDSHFSEDLQVACFCQRGPAFFLPFSSLVAAF